MIADNYVVKFGFGSKLALLTLPKLAEPLSQTRLPKLSTTTDDNTHEHTMEHITVSSVI